MPLEVDVIEGRDGVTIRVTPLPAVPDPRTGELVRAVQDLQNRIEQMSGTMQTVIDTLSASVAKLTTVEASVQAFVEGVPALIKDAVDKALAAGATPAQMAALTELTTALTAKVDELATNVVANTPAA